MIDLVLVKRRISKPDQDSLIKDSTDNFKSMMGSGHRISTLVRYKNSTLPRDLNKYLSDKNGDTIIIADCGFVLNKGFDDNVLKPLAYGTQHNGSNKRVGVIGVKIVNPQSEIVDVGIKDPLKEMPIWRYYYERNVDFRRNIAESRFDQHNLFIDSKFIIINRKAYDEVGGFDEESDKLWAVDFCFSVYKKEWLVVYKGEEITTWNIYERDLVKLQDEYRTSQDYFRNKWFKEQIKSSESSLEAIEKSNKVKKVGV